MKKSKKSDNTGIARKRVRPPSAEHEEVVGAAVGAIVGAGVGGSSGR